MCGKAMDALLKSNPSWKLLSKTKLWANAKRADPSLSKTSFDTWYKSNGSVTNELFARPLQSLKFARIAAPPYSYQTDVVLIPKYRTVNNGVYRLLLLVELCSRKAWAFPLKDEKMDTILSVYKPWLASLKTRPYKIEADNAFSAAAFREANKGIPVITMVADKEHVTRGNPLGIIDSLVRTLKQLIEKRIRADDDPKWTKWIHEILSLYNSSEHSSLDESPNSVFGNDAKMQQIYEQGIAYNRQVSKPVVDAFRKDNYVRVRLQKDTFTKGTTQTMSNEVYQVVKVQGTRVALKTYPDGVLVARSYKPNELVKVDRPLNVAPAAKQTKARKAATTATKVAKEGIAVSKKLNAPRQTRTVRKSPRLA
jgi:hypothetical protein